MANFSAIAPGTDLPQHARQLRRIHDAVLGGQQPIALPRPVVQRSWSRVVGFGLESGLPKTRDPLPRDEIERRRRASPLSTVIGELSGVIRDVADASSFLMVVTDADGVILWRSGASSVRRTADQLGFSEGATWTERMVGTNAIGTALAEAAPVQLFSAEHFEAAQHPWYCTACPIHDPRTGDLLGIVDVSGPALSLHPAVGALVQTGVRLAESMLWRHHEARLERLQGSAENVVSATGGAALVVDEHGWVAHHVGVSTRDRISAPSEGMAILIPGIGLCLPERIRDGWLIRSQQPLSEIEAVLDLSGAPVLHITGGGQPWRTPLTPRHAQLISILAEVGPAGIDAAALSRRIHGDEQHIVTVRAEISRLRRIVGALVTTRPYRLAEGVRVTRALGDPPSRVERTTSDEVALPDQDETGQRGHESDDRGN